MMRILTICGMLFLFGCSMAEPEQTTKAKGYPDAKVTRLVRIIDGDTFVCDIDDLSPIAGKNISIRLRNINTPELRDRNPEKRKAALEEKQRLSDILTNARTIELKNIGRCKYFRILADVYADGEYILPRLNPEYIIDSGKVDK